MLVDYNKAIIFDQNNILYPFEIKKTALPNEPMIENYSKLNGGRRMVEDE